MTRAIVEMSELPPAQQAALLREEANFMDAQIDDEENPGIQCLMCERVKKLLKRAEEIEAGSE